jgi:asparagine synthase (glutamine-hydrolysing)
MSMAHSLEVRVPLLDHKLVEYVLRLPEAVKMAGEGPKPLMVKAIGDLLPAAIRDRREKQGFEFPFTQWMRGPMKAQVQSKVMGAAKVSGLRPEAVRTMWNEYEAGQRHWSRVWALAAVNSVA